MQVGCRQLSLEEIGRIVDIAGVAANESIRELSRRICRELDWRSPNGRFQEMSCRKILSKLKAEGVIHLKPGGRRYGFEERKGQSSILPVDVPEISCGLADLGPVEVVPVSSRYAKDSRIWNGLFDAFHYLGSRPLCGAQIRYLIRSEDKKVLGGLSFSSATARLKARDEWIGWSEKARRNNLHRVVLNSRFLILPTVKVAHLASRVLSLVAARIGKDWEERYGVEPVLLETFVDGAQFQGTCYRAANWIHIGQSAGRKSAFANGKISSGKKEVFVYPLNRGISWKRQLCEEPKRVLRAPFRPSNFSNWTEEEFGAIEVFDDRLKERVCTLAKDFFARPGAMVPEACGGSIAKAKAAYRFFNNENISMEVLLKSHIEATGERVRRHKVVLAVQDTTTLDYTMHPDADGIGPICHQSDNCMGLILHDTMAFNEEGTPLGLLDVQCWARDLEERGKKAKRHLLPIEEKESIKWLRSFRAVAEMQALCPETMLVSVGDREADIYELFDEASKSEKGLKLLVRADKWRKRKVDGELLFDKILNEPVAGRRCIHVSRTEKRKAREAELEIRFGRVTLTPPKDKALPPLTVCAVYVREVNHKASVKEPIEWMLLTTVEVTTLEQAEQCIRWYGKRWGIEVYHRTLKSGCRIEDRRLGDAHSLEACIAVDMVVAWRVFLLTMQSREHPELPCDAVLSEDEWRTLCVFYTQKLPPNPPPMKEIIVLIAKLGGFLGRVRDGNPGTETVWRGLWRLTDITIGFKAAEELYRRAGPFP